jgi:transcriptional regulator with GAF, ATPase, and Fis domain
MNELIVSIFRRQYNTTLGFFTNSGSFWTGNLKSDIAQIFNSDEKTVNRTLGIEDKINSLALIPLVVGDDCIGLLQFTCCQKDYFTKYEIEHFEITAVTGASQRINLFVQHCPGG